MFLFKNRLATELTFMASALAPQIILLLPTENATTSANLVLTTSIENSHTEG